MCLDDRRTDSRVRPRAATLILRRTVAVRRAVRSVNLDMARPLLLLSFLAEDILVCVLHTFALVRLGWSVAADLGSDMADFLLVDAAHDNFGRLWRRNCDPFRNRETHVVGKPKLQLQRLALNRRAVADASNFQFLLEALGYA